jgi:hypothetical protein
MSRPGRMFIGRSTTVAGRWCEQCGAPIELPGLIVRPDMAVCSRCGISAVIRGSGPNVWAEDVYRLVWAAVGLGGEPALWPDSLEAAMTEAECPN